MYNSSFELLMSKMSLGKSNDFRSVGVSSVIQIVNSDLYPISRIAQIGHRSFWVVLYGWHKHGSKTSSSAIAERLGYEIISFQYGTTSEMKYNNFSG